MNNLVAHNTKNKILQEKNIIWQPQASKSYYGLAVRVSV